ncbi:MAG: hypothetical protein EZS28_038588 [Streblomastix strix]|uniref:Uncharacterized protein n=1 Tax=Streblomastix strix TaxID=222440 RepID=A0A5J4U520_9EUKA|nr:MAG: hypothetical protein EZS28_038588 [Streblomastix strix]
MRGLIHLGLKSEILRLEQCLISNIGIEDKGSAILMNDGLNSKLELMNGVILEAIYTSLRITIQIIASSNCSIEVELVIFKEFVSDVSLNRKGEAIQVNMTQFELKLSVKRFLFIGNDAESYTNFYIAYRNQQQRVSYESLIGCRAVTGITDEQDISFCFEIINETDQYINE